jgi:hypothetical protein
LKMFIKSVFAVAHHVYLIHALLVALL